MSVIRTQALTKYYGPRVGVSDLLLEVPEGSVFGFIGPNGAGKTTAIRLLLGFLRPDRGSAWIFERDCWRESHIIKREVGYVPGDLRLHSWITTRDALQIVGGARGLDLSAPGHSLAESFELDPTVRVRAMSRGMRQKLGLILALAHEPRLLILDEPTSALDPLTQDLLYQHLRAAAGRGSTVFFSSHVLSEVQDLCDRVAIVRRGQLVAQETLEVLRQRARRSVVVRWAHDREATPPEPPSFLKVYEREDSTWECGLDGPVEPLLEWLRGKPVDDLAITPPDLDSLFLRYYRDGAEA